MDIYPIVEQYWTLNGDIKSVCSKSGHFEMTVGETKVLLETVCSSLFWILKSNMDFENQGPRNRHVCLI